MPACTPATPPVYVRATYVDQLMENGSTRERAERIATSVEKCRAELDACVADGACCPACGSPVCDDWERKRPSA